jgi:hypothetical protein
MISSLQIQILLTLAQSLILTCTTFYSGGMAFILWTGGGISKGDSTALVAYVLSPAALFSASLRAASGEEKFVKQPGVPFLVAEGEVHPDLRGVLEL